MVAKLHAYRYDDSWEYPEDTILSETFATSRQTGDHAYYYLLNYTLAQVNNINSRYGLKYRVLSGIRGDNGQVTEALIFGWGEDGGLARLILKDLSDNVGGWSNGYPEDGSKITVKFRSAKPYINPEFHTSVDVSADIIDDTLVITKEIESVEKFDLLVSSATIELAETTAIKSFMDTYWTTEKVVIGGVGQFFAMGLELEGRFVGHIAPENIIYNEELGTYLIDAFDWIKWLQSGKWNNFIPHYLSPNLTDFLNQNTIQFNAGSTTEISVGDISLDWDTLDYRAYYRKLGSDPTQWHYTVLDKHMTITSFIVETFKHYNAIMYFNGDGNLVFKSKASVGETVHDNASDILSETLDESFGIRDFDGLVLNVKYWGTAQTYEGWILLWLEDGETRTKSLGFSMGGIDDKFRYLDLRQNFGSPWFEAIVFDDRTEEQRLVDYGDLLIDKTLLNIEVAGLGYELFDTFLHGGNTYRIIYVQEDDTRGTSELGLEQYG